MRRSFVVPPDSPTLRRTVLSLLATLLLLPPVAAAEKPAGKPSPEEAIRATVDSYVAAFNRGDAQAVAAHWSPGGVWVSPQGRRVQGPAAIQKELEAFFAANPGVRIDDVRTSIRPVSSDVAVEEGSVRVIRPGAAPEESPYIAVHVRQGDQWRMDTVRELENPAEPPLQQNLKQLEWMLGDWVDAGPDSTVETSVAWSQNKSFLLGNFRVSAPGMEHLEGMQVIGWDPADGLIRSWIFDSDGGFGHGLWSRKDDRWMVKFNQVLADGRRASATNIYTLVDGDRYSWQSIGREVDGRFQPNIEPVTVVRKTAAAKAEPPSAAGEAKPQKESKPQKPEK